MPELPEVETVRAGLAPRIEGRSIRQVVGKSGRMFRKNPGGFKQAQLTLSAAGITGVHRRGKFMWLTLGGEEEGDLAFVIHLGMSGQVHWQSPASAGPGQAKHEHLWVELSDRSGISFVDQRTFGHLTVSPLTRSGMRLVPELMAHIAPDPLEEDFSWETVTRRGANSQRKIKTLLLDQELVSGIGNIYADEALHMAGLAGHLPGGELSAEDWHVLLEAAKKVLLRALKAGGTSFDALYVDVEGNPGYFARSLAVYGRAGRPCRKCGTRIERVRIDGRSHYFCPAQCMATR